MFAHSMGNVVASQALRIEALKEGPRELLRNYAACQAASVASAYDSEKPRVMDSEYIRNHPGINFSNGTELLFELSSLTSDEIPDLYGEYPVERGDNGKVEYFYGIDEVVSHGIINVHNWLDDALAAWMIGQWQKPDSEDLGSTYWGYSKRGVISGPHVPWRGPKLLNGGYRLEGRELDFDSQEDTFEIFAHIAEAKSPALGASVNGDNRTAGVISWNLDTSAEFSRSQRFTGAGEDHSAQFRSINMERWQFWQSFLVGNTMLAVDVDYRPRSFRSWD
jgi:hypothetical protein